jgi:hypothetical protein
MFPFPVRNGGHARLCGVWGVSGEFRVSLELRLRALHQAPPASLPTVRALNRFPASEGNSLQTSGTIRGRGAHPGTRVYVARGGRFFFWTSILLVRTAACCLDLRLFILSGSEVCSPPHPLSSPTAIHHRRCHLPQSPQREEPAHIPGLNENCAAPAPRAGETDLADIWRSTRASRSSYWAGLCRCGPSVSSKRSGSCALLPLP